ncbi:MAG: alpha-hydroxy acid oxidase [Woeseia sp.]
MKKVAAISDLRTMAQSRVPKVIFDYLEGGADSESGLVRNRAAFRDLLLKPRYLVDVSSRDSTVTLFGKTYAAPFGFAPIGIANLIWPRAEQMAAATAASENIPFILSTASASTIEEIAAIGGRNVWFQLYPSSNQEITFDLVSRAEAAQCGALVVTVDVPVPGKRNRDLRNGFGLPMRLGIGGALDFARRRAWALGVLKHGIPTFANLERYMDGAAKRQSLASFMASQISGGFDWAALRAIRQRWSGPLVLKGILQASDARRAAEEGVDGIIVSNHGGRQLDSAPASLGVVSGIRAAVGDSISVILDSGVRSGADIVKAIATGAEFVFCGRAWIYGVAAGGQRGASRAVQILQQEVDCTLAQIGCPRLAELDHSWLVQQPSS